MREEDINSKSNNFFLFAGGKLIAEGNSDFLAICIFNKNELLRVFQ